ncbi:hypothetical protein [Embleya sp. NBC_00896]|uniref:hypothetical protein n=1 Tax=Embleya sp. NBC_00896 TaxID=2975961 RepID=UPI003869CAB7|nr:hypothetical protein OG928_04260 [Embleya sp. NBC_00896]
MTKPSAAERGAERRVYIDGRATLPHPDAFRRTVILRAARRLYFSTIYKPLHAQPYTVDDRPAGIFAAPVTASELTDAVRTCPHLFQERVDKVADVRVTVVGERTFAARITAPTDVLDWRADYAHLNYDVVECPPEVTTGMQHMLRQFGLSFGAFDFAVTSAGEWWFLELNPNGEWAWVEDRTELPIASALADVLQDGETRT